MCGSPETFNRFSTCSLDLIHCVTHLLYIVMNFFTSLILSTRIPCSSSDCSCHSAGSVESAGGECNQTSGQCSCKTNVGGLQCDRCLPGFYNLSSSNSNGCQPCNCQFGSSESLDMCDSVSGRCLCRPGFTGRDCGVLTRGFYVPNLNIVLEAEDQVWGSNVVTLSSIDSNSRPFTGRGFARIEPIANNVSEYVFMIPSSLLPSIFQSYCVSVRSAPSESVSADTCLSTSEFLGEYEIAPCTSQPCSVDLRYVLTTSDGGNISEVLFIDSLVLIPQLDLLFGNFTELLGANSSSCLNTCIDSTACSSNNSLNALCEAAHIQASAQLYNGTRGEYHSAANFEQSFSPSLDNCLMSRPAF